MKIGILADILNEHSGARASIKLGEALAKIGQCEIVFFTTDKLLNNETLVRVKKKHGVRIFKKPTFISLELVRLLKDEGLDLISAHCSLRILISAYLSGIKIFRTDYGTQFPSLNGNYGSWRVSRVKRLYLLLGDLYVFLRDYLKFCFAHINLAISLDHTSRIKKLFGKKTDYIYLGGNDFDKIEAGKNSAEKARILSVSRFVPYKGFHILIEAFKLLEKETKNIELVLVGGQADKIYFELLKKLAADKPNIRFVFDPSDAVLGQLFSSSQIYASGTRWEAFGLPFLEASYFGLPVLGFNYFGPAKEVVKDGLTGYLVGGGEEFTDKLRQLIVNPSLCEDLGRQGQAFAQGFTWDKCASEYLEIFKKNK